VGLPAAQAVPIASGDYIRNGVVDAADYVLWRKMQGSSVANYASPDGSGNGNVGSEDYTVWRSHFGQASPVSGAGSGSSVFEAVLASESSSPQESAASHAVDEKLMVKTTAVATADFTAFDLSFFQATIAPTGRVAVPPAFIRQGHGALVGNTVLQDQGSPAWLSASYPDEFNSKSDFGDASHGSLADDADHRRNAADSVFDTGILHCEQRSNRS